MTTTHTRNLRLRISSEMTTDARYNLEVLDGAFSSFVTTMAGTKVFNSTNGFQFNPAGTSPGGSVAFGGQTTPLASFRVYGPLNGSLLQLQPVTGDFYFALLPSPSMTANITYTLPSVAGTVGQSLIIDPLDATRLVFGDIDTDPMTDEEIVAAQLGELLLLNTAVVPGDSIETAIGKLQGLHNNLTPLRAMDLGVLVKTNAEGFLTELTEVTPAELVSAVLSSGSARVSFLTADFQALTPGLWTLEIPATTHGLGTNVHVSCIADSTPQQVWVDRVTIDGSGNVALSVLSEPDLRFDGSVVIAKTGVI